MTVVHDDEYRALAEALARDYGVERLARGLSLSSRFHFYLLVCDIPRAVALILDFFRDEVVRQRDAPVRFVVLDPYRAHAHASEPISFDLLVQEVLARLVSPEPDERTNDVIFVIDASKAIAQDEPAWMLMFQRMNEQRNSIAAVLGGPLLLAVPAWLERVFAHAAPDFWSIRTTAVLVHVPEEYLATKPLANAVRSHDMPGIGADETEIEWGDIEKIDQEIESLHKRLQDHPADETAEMALVVWLGRRASYERQQGRISDALTTMQEAYGIFHARLERQGHAGSRPLATYGLQVLLRAARNAGLRDRAIALAEQGVAITRRACELESDNEAHKKALVIMLQELANGHWYTGTPFQAIRARREAYEIAERMHQETPSEIGWCLHLAVSAIGLGDAWTELNDSTNALEAYENARQWSETALALVPQSIKAQLYLCLSYFGIGSAYSGSGALTLAVDAYEKAHAGARRLLDLEPDDIEWLERSALALECLGELHWRMGDLARGLAAKQQSIEILRDNVRRDPERILSRKVLAVSLATQSELLQHANEGQRALDALREADAQFKVLAKTGDMDASTQMFADLCREQINLREAAIAEGVRATLPLTHGEDDVLQPPSKASI